MYWVRGGFATGDGPCGKKVCHACEALVTRDHRLRNGAPTVGDGLGGSTEQADALKRLVEDRTPDERTRQPRMETAVRLHTAALEGLITELVLLAESGAAGQRQRDHERRAAGRTAATSLGRSTPKAAEPMPGNERAAHSDDCS